MEEILFFTGVEVVPFHFEENPKKPTMGLTLKRTSENLPNDVLDSVVLQVVYGNSRQHPGDDNSPSQKFMKIDADGREFVGLWAPPNSRCKALALKLLFPSLSKHYKLPEIKREPLHVAMAFDVFKTNELMDLAKEYPEDVMKFGFFTTDAPFETQLIAKTVEEFERRSALPTFEEKIIFQISKENKECYNTFLKQGPSYKSANVEIGEMDCKILFPSGYNDPPPEEKPMVKKTKKRRAKANPETTADEEGKDVIQTMIANENTETTEGTEETKTEEVEEEDTEDNEEENEDEVDLEQNNDNLGEEKATSPMEEA